jgi:hypothetical protein
MFLPPEKIPRGAKNYLDNCSTHGRNIFPFAETASPGLSNGIYRQIAIVHYNAEILVPKSFWKAN